MQAIEHAVIAAAGLGSRLGHGKPKCLVEVAGRMVLEYQLDLLRDVPDVRIVVGYCHHEVIEAALGIRPDVTIVRNAAYRETTTQHSYWLGSRYLDRTCLYMDGDIIFAPHSFNDFINAASTREALIGVTETKTEDPVFAHLAFDLGAASSMVSSFDRRLGSPWEWANIALMHPAMLTPNGGPVFERLRQFLPLPAASVECYEIDTQADLELAESFARQLVKDRFNKPDQECVQPSAVLAPTEI